MFSLFISFDILISYFNQLIFWVFIIFFFFFFLVDFFIYNYFVFINFIHFLLKEIVVASKLKSNFNIKLYISIFLLIFFSNFLGIWPFFYTLSSQLNFCFFLSLVFWLSIIINNIFLKLDLFMPHLVPSGTPLVLSQFMVLIETVSQLIRPLTLGVRLMANITAGHLIMILCSGSFFFFSYITFPLLLLLVLEFIVALIQAYVFIILLSIYLGEFNN